MREKLCADAVRTLGPNTTEGGHDGESISFKSLSLISTSKSGSRRSVTGEAAGCTANAAALLAAGARLALEGADLVTLAFWLVPACRCLHRCLGVRDHSDPRRAFFSGFGSLGLRLGGIAPAILGGWGRQPCAQSSRGIARRAGRLRRLFGSFFACLSFNLASRDSFVTSF
jgi:hypothetical protein